MSVEESWRLRELRSFVGSQRKTQNVLECRKMMEQWKCKGFKGLSNVFGNANDS